MKLFLAKVIGALLQAWEKLTVFLKRFSRHTYTTVAVILLCVLLLIDVGYHFVQNFSSPLETMTARVGTLGESIALDAYLVREETPFVEEGGNCRYYVEDGEKVKKGMPLVAIYPDSVSEEVLNSLYGLAQAKKILESVDSARPEKVSETLALRIEGVTLTVEEALREGNIQKANREKETLSALMLAREEMIGLTDVKAVLDEISRNISTLESMAGTPDKIITAKESGWFSDTVDGYESFASADTVSKMSYTELRSLLEKKSVSPSGSVGKMVESHQFYAVAFTQVENTQFFSTNRQYRVTLDGRSLLLTLEKVVRQNDEDTVAFVFSSSSLTESLSMSRVSKLTLTVEEHEGFKIPTSALAENKGVFGVYILKGFEVQFREISVIYRKDNMMIAEVSPENKSGQFRLLAENDNIIIKGEDLYDGKIVQGVS